MFTGRKSPHPLPPLVANHAPKDAPSGSSPQPAGIAPARRVPSLPSPGESRVMSNARANPARLGIRQSSSSDSPQRPELAEPSGALALSVSANSHNKEYVSSHAADSVPARSMASTINTAFGGFWAAAVNGRPTVSRTAVTQLRGISPSAAPVGLLPYSIGRLEDRVSVLDRYNSGTSGGTTGCASQPHRTAAKPAVPCSASAGDLSAASTWQQDHRGGMAPSLPRKKDVVGEHDAQRGTTGTSLVAATPSDGTGDFKWRKPLKDRRDLARNTSVDASDPLVELQQLKNLLHNQQQRLAMMATPHSPLAPRAISPAPEASSPPFITTDPTGRTDAISEGDTKNPAVSESGSSAGHGPASKGLSELSPFAEVDRGVAPSETPFTWSPAGGGVSPMSMGESRETAESQCRKHSTVASSAGQATEAVDGDPLMVPTAWRFGSLSDEGGDGGTGLRAGGDFDVSSTNNSQPHPAGLIVIPGVRDVAQSHGETSSCGAASMVGTTPASPKPDLRKSSSPGGRDSRRHSCERSHPSMFLGRMSMRSSSCIRLTDSTMAIMEMLGNQPDVVLPAPHESGLSRRGDVLSSNHVLKVDLQDALRQARGPTGMISGGPNFRMVPKLNIGGVAQPNISAIRTIINELHYAYSNGPIVWVNLREEPLIYINNVAHIVRERDEPLKPVIIPNITGRGITLMEAKLKLEVLEESASNEGNICVHSEGKDGFLEDQWECATEDQVFTTLEVFESLCANGYSNIIYKRQPITQNVGPKATDFDFVFDVCQENLSAVLLFNCQTGRGRTSAMMQIACIVRFYQFCTKDIAADVRVMRGDTRTYTFRTIQKIVSLIPEGKLHERRLAILMELSDKVYSIADHINAAFTADEVTQEGVVRLRQYACFVAFSYYCEQRIWARATTLPFSKWLDDFAELKVLIDRIALGQNLQLLEERVVAPGESSPSNGIETADAIRWRVGNVLSSGRVLCSMPMEEVGTISTLRQLAPGVPIFTCGRIDEIGRQLLVQRIREAFPERKRFQWISLRAEPMVFINNTSYALMDYSAIHKELSETGITMHVSRYSIEQIEERLREDVIAEAASNNGEIVLHRFTDSSHATAMRVPLRSVNTPKSMMEEFSKSLGIDYYRIPIPFSGVMLPLDVDPLLAHLRENSCNDDVVLINDSEGSSRTTVALNLLTLYRVSLKTDLRLVRNEGHVRELLRCGTSNVLLDSALLAAVTTCDHEPPSHPIELEIASTVSQMLTGGSLLRVVSAVINFGGHGYNWNVLHALDFFKNQIMDAENKVLAVRRAGDMVRAYLLILLTALYLDAHGDYDSLRPLSQWIASLGEVQNVFNHLDEHPESFLKYVVSANLMKADVSRREGDVLTANFALKADHFPGCQKKGLVPVVCGAPNFRKVDRVNVYGTAIPTLVGVRNVLSLLGASSEPMVAYPGEENDAELFRGYASPRIFDRDFDAPSQAGPLHGSVVWINLREEPILYVGDRPFVFRNLSAPYVNVELTGIESEKVERIEERLKVDVLAESQRYDGQFLVHDEGNPGELVGMWEAANAESVRTVREVYEELARGGVRVSLVRLPVTDEQSPELRDFDTLAAALLPAITQHTPESGSLSFVFNCQMGRGRTTTGMVICCLLIGRAYPEYYTDLRAQHTSLFSATDSTLLRGDYSCIVQLKRVLPGGREAKDRVDLILEACSKMQNLRTAIEAFVVQLQSSDVTESNRARAHHHGVHYLQRYFNLIAFEAYLSEEYDAATHTMNIPFVTWMEQHPELVSLNKSATLK